MLNIDPQNTTVKRMLQTWERRSQERRTYIGASVIGTECSRKLWMSFRWAFVEKFEGRILRLFNRGQREEAVFIQELLDIGCQVEGLQHGGEACNGHFRYHCDGVVLGLVEAPKTWHVVDFKTMGEKSYKRFIGCKTADDLFKEFPEYFAQLQVEMLLMGLERSALFAVNKNTDELHMMRMELDKDASTFFLRKAEEIIGAVAPAACERTPADFRCRFCAAHALCFGEQCPEINCRTCCYSTPVEDGKWVCDKRGGDVLDKETMRAGCNQHIWIPGLLTWEMSDHGDGWVLYANGLVNAGKGVDVPEGVECAAQALSVEIMRNFSSIRNGDFSTLLKERNSFPEATEFEQVEGDADPRRQQLLQLIKEGDEQAKEDYYKEFGGSNDTGN